jgi:hypothetical protein
MRFRASLNVQPISSPFLDRCIFERDIPFELRCQAAMLVLPSAFPDPQQALASSPPVKKGRLQLTFQQHTLALNVGEAIMFLQRPYFMKALHEDPVDPARSRYGRSYMTVIERCSVSLEGRIDIGRAQSRRSDPKIPMIATASTGDNHHRPEPTAIISDGLSEALVSMGGLNGVSTPAFLWLIRIESPGHSTTSSPPPFVWAPSLYSPRPASCRNSP